MARITKNPLPPPLRPEHLGGLETIVCRVKDVLVDVASPQTRRGKATVLLVWEYPEHGVYLNETSKEHAVAGFKSDETNDWKDKYVPLIVTRSEFQDRDSGRVTMGRKIWIAPPEQWATLLKNAPKAERAKPPTPEK